MDATLATRAVTTSTARTSRRPLLEEWRREWVTLALVLPGVVYFIVFHYLPLLGYIIAFQDYLPFLGFAKPVGRARELRGMVADPALLAGGAATRC